jgi:hypothetical protein
VVVVSKVVTSKVPVVVVKKAVTGKLMHAGPELEVVSH